MDLVLRTWTDADVPVLVDLVNRIDHTYLGGLPSPFGEKEALWYINRCRSNERKNGIFRAIVVDGTTCGVISISRLFDLLMKDAQFGGYLLPEFCNRGIMTRALHMMCHMAFLYLDIERISAPIMGENWASRRVVVKNGFKLEGNLKHAIWKDERYHDLVIYSKLREYK